jgi:opacity protein-like surface antigen
VLYRRSDRVGDQMIQILGPMPSPEELRARLRKANEDSETVHLEASATGHWDNQNPVFDVLLEIGNDAFHGSLGGEYDGTGALTFSVGTDIEFRVLGKAVDLNAAVGYDVVNHAWNVLAGVKIDVLDRWSMSANYTIDQSGKQEVTLTVTFHF